MKQIKELPYASYQVSLKILFKNRRGRTLILKTRPDGSMPGHYDLPGGRINKSELSVPIAQLIRREIREELGGKVRYNLHEVPVGIGRHEYFSKKIKKKIPVLWILFQATYLSGAIIISDEHVDFDWKKLNQRNMSMYFTKGALQVMRNYLTHKLP